MKKILLCLLWIAILLIHSSPMPCYAEKTNEIHWAIDTVMTINPELADSINEMTESAPDSAHHTCVWVMGWMDIPDHLYYQLDYGSIDCRHLPDGVIVDTAPAVEDRNRHRTSKNGLIRDQIGVVVYIDKKYDAIEKLDSLFSENNLSVALSDWQTNESIDVFPCLGSDTHTFDSIPHMDMSAITGESVATIDSISPVSEDMAAAYGFYDLLQYIYDGYQCWIIRFHVAADTENLPMESFYTQTRNREQSFILAKGDYAFLGSFMEGNHIDDGYIDAFLITQSAVDANDIEAVENMLMSDELTLCLAPTQLLLSYGLEELRTPWIISAPLTSNDGKWKVWSDRNSASESK